jgi:RNA polymerase sigma-70 factor (ECF subfamily)
VHHCRLRLTAAPIRARVITAAMTHGWRPLTFSAKDHVPEGQPPESRRVFSTRWAIDARLIVQMQAGVPNLFELYQNCVHNAGNHPDCEQFFGQVRPVMLRIASRVARQFGVAMEADDIVQEISLKMLSSGQVILALLPKHPAETLAYVSVLSANTARDFFRARHACKRGLERTIALDESVARVAAAIGMRNSIDQALLMSQIESCLPEDRREQMVFRLYYRQGFTAKEIAAIPALNLTIKGVESMLYRISQHVRESIRQTPRAASSEKGNRPQVS